MPRKTKKCLYSPEGHRIEVYRKGKRHKVLVDIHNGRVVATNPVPLMMLAALPKVLAAGKKVFDVARQVKGAMPSPEPTELAAAAPPSAHPPRKTNFDKALALEQLEMQLWQPKRKA